MKILHAPTNVGSNPSGIVRAEQSLGLDSVQIVINPAKITSKTNVSLWAPSDNFFTKILKQLLLIIQAGEKYDLVHFNGGKSLACVPVPSNKFKILTAQGLLRAAYQSYSEVLQRFELSYLKRQVPIFVTFQGTDARRMSHCLKNHTISHYHESGQNSNQSTERHIVKQVELFDSVADCIFTLNPDLLEVLPERAEFLPYASVDFRDFELALPKNRPDRFVHAPSDRVVKGTEYILTAVSELRKEGYEFEFYLAENMTHSEALETYSLADVAIDQLLVGWYGGFAVEAMAFGKPVISYIRETDASRIPEKMRDDLPIVSATPDTIKSVMRSVIEMRHQDLLYLGRRSRSFVVNWHDPLKVADFLNGKYENAISKWNNRKV